MDNEFVLAPALVSVRFDLDPVGTMLHSLRLLNKAEQFSGLHDWITRTASALPAERMHTNEIVFNVFDPIVFMPKEAPVSFPALISLIERMRPAQIIEAVAAELERMYDEHPDHMARFERRVTFTELLSDRAAFIAFMNKMDECEQSDLFGESFDRAQNPAELQRTIVEHLRFMWDNHLRAEWEHQLPLLNESINAFNRIDFSHKTALEAARIVTNRDLSEVIEKKLLNSHTVRFVPHPHLGPYIAANLSENTLSIMFGVRLPRGAQSAALSEFSRAELLIRLNALADDTRLQILELLTQHAEMCAQDIIERLNVSQSTVSRHLSQLRATGYIIERRREVSKCYSLNTDRVVDTLRALTNFLSRE